MGPFAPLRSCSLRAALGQVVHMPLRMERLSLGRNAKQYGRPRIWFRSDGVWGPLIRFPTLQHRNFLRELVARPSGGGRLFLMIALLVCRHRCRICRSPWSYPMMPLQVLLLLFLPLRLLLLLLLPLLLPLFLLLLGQRGTRSRRKLPRSRIPMMTLDSVIFRGFYTWCRRCFRMAYLLCTMK